MTCRLSGPRSTQSPNTTSVSSGFTSIVLRSAAERLHAPMDIADSYYA